MVDRVSADASARYTYARLGAVVARVVETVAARRTTDPQPDDPFRGLYLPEAHISWLLTEDPAGELAGAADGRARDPTDRRTDADPPGETASHAVRVAAALEAAGVPLRLVDVAARCGLTAAAVDILLLALAPDLDHRLEQLYGYLHNDVSRCRASVGLALQLAGLDRREAAARAMLLPGAPLIATGLVVVADPERPFLSRALRVPDRVTQHLLGHDEPEPAVRRLLVEPAAAGTSDAAGTGDARRAAQPIAAAVRAGRSRLVYLREPRELGAAWEVGRAVVAELGAPPLVVDLTRLPAGAGGSPGGDAEPGGAGRAGVLAAVALEARLRGAGLVAGPIEDLGGPSTLAPPAAEATLATEPGIGIIVLTGHGAWEPGWAPDVPLVVEVAAPGRAARVHLWQAGLDGAGPPAAEIDRAVGGFALGPRQIARAATAAALQATLAGRPVRRRDLHDGARAQNGTGLERLAHRVRPAAGWADLVLPEGTARLLRELAARARWRDRVRDEWGMGRGGGRGDGITALFAGPSGTGKTLAAEVISGELGLDLYAIDLAMVVDKYVGETEKNLDRLFAEAERVNGVLFFDEADALFGTRSEVRDARDRYANVETAYLLQRMESFDGIAVLATNLRANLDEAFARRLDAVIDFPVPDEPSRLAMWERHLGARVPRADDLDLAFCARAFELSGGNIRNVTRCAAFLAADEDRPVGMIHLIRGVEREYRKLGRLCLESEFGPWLPALD